MINNIILVKQNSKLKKGINDGRFKKKYEDQKIIYVDDAVLEQWHLNKSEYELKINLINKRFIKKGENSLRILVLISLIMVIGGLVVYSSLQFLGIAIIVIGFTVLCICSYCFIVYGKLQKQIMPIQFDDEHIKLHATLLNWKQNRKKQLSKEKNEAENDSMISINEIKTFEKKIRQLDGRYFLQESYFGNPE